MLLAVQSIQSAQSLLFFVCPVQAYPGAFPTLIGYAWGPGIDVLISEAKEPGYERGKMLLSAGLFYMHHHLPSAQINTLNFVGGAFLGPKNQQKPGSSKCSWELELPFLKGRLLPQPHFPQSF